MQTGSNWQKTYVGNSINQALPSGTKNSWDNTVIGWGEGQCCLVGIEMGGNFWAVPASVLVGYYAQTNKTRHFSGLI